MEFFNLLSEVKPYNTSHEKDALLYTSGKDINFKTLVHKLGVTEDINDLSEHQLEMLIFKLREISVGDIVEVRYTCKKCKSPSIGQISIPKMFRDETHPDIHGDIKLGIFDEDEIYSVIDQTHKIDDLSIPEYDELVRKYEENNKTLFNKSQLTKCLMCGDSNLISLKAPEIISKSTLADIYNNYTDLSYFAAHGFQDVSVMLPFEREIMMALLHNKIEKEKG